MIKVLILAYDFPPYVSVGGIRPFNWYKFFPNFNIYPVVITRQWTNKFSDYRDYISPSESIHVLVESDAERTIIRSPYFPNMANKILLKHGEKKFRSFRRMVSAFYEFGQFLLPIGPKRQILKAADEYLGKNKVDVIIATGDPFILFKYAAKLSDKYNIPWIADYRDPWIHNTAVKKNYFVNLWDAYFEKKIVSKASQVTTVAKFIQDHVKEAIPKSNCHVIPNGYDPDTLDEAMTVPQPKDSLHIGYAGSIADWSPINSFFKGCSRFIKQRNGARLVINFYGIQNENYIRELISKDFPELQEVVKIHSKIPNAVLMKKLASNHVFLLFNYYSIIGTKIYDYVALGRKILFCFSDDKEADELKKKFFHVLEDRLSIKKPQEELLESTSTGIMVNDGEHLPSVLNELYNEFELSGSIKCNAINVENYSRKNHTGQLAGIIQTLK
jgi:hypothetical protein